MKARLNFIYCLVSVVCFTACLPDPELSVPSREPPPLPSQPTGCTKSKPTGEVGYGPGKLINPELQLTDDKGTFSIGSLHDPCGASTNLVVVRLVSSWCGPCRWQVAHTSEILKAAAPGRIQVIDVLVRDQLNIRLQPELKSFDELRPFYDTVPRLTIQSGPTLVSYFDIRPDSKYRLPVVAIIDTKTLHFVDVLAAPAPDQLIELLQKTLAQADGLPAPLPSMPQLHDGRFSRDRWEMIQQMRLAADWQPPLDPSNRHESNSDAVTLGRSLFFDETLTAAGTMGCVTCHAPSKAFADGRQTARGLLPNGTPAIGDRNTPWLGGLAATRFLFWDGRIDSLWAQALGPFENDREISSNRLHVIRASLARYGAAYTKVFGAAPDLSDTTRFPLDARPGMAAWDGMTAADRDTANRIYSNLGKAIAAYERQIRPLPVALDRYAAGDTSALTSDEKDGLARFFDVGCAQCHYGPMLSDFTLHDNYFPTGRVDGDPDIGRLTAISALLTNDFRTNGPYSDSPQTSDWLRGLEQEPTIRGQFRTMSLRGIADTAPYTHGGQSLTLTDLVTLYAEAGLPDGDPRTTGGRDLAVVKFEKTDPQNQQLVKFLMTFKATVSAP